MLARESTAHGYGGARNDTLYDGAGVDMFIFNTDLDADTYVDVIAGFVVI